jgi:hypothetical protein
LSGSNNVSKTASTRQPGDTMRSAIVILLGLSVHAAQAEDASIESLIKDVAKVQGQFVTEFRAIKDKQSAQAARKDLERLGRERDQALRSIGQLKLTPIERESAQTRLDEGIKAINEMLQTEVARVSMIPAALKEVDDLPVVKEMAVLVEDRARSRAANVEKALKVYMIKNDGNPPEKLADVGRYLADPKADLKDPWGQEFQLGSAERGTVTTYYVWTQSPFGGGKKVGTMRPDK